MHSEQQKQSIINHCIHSTGSNIYRSLTISALFITLEPVTVQIFCRTLEFSSGYFNASDSLSWSYIAYDEFQPFLLMAKEEALKISDGYD